MTKTGVIVESQGLYYKVQDIHNDIYTCVIRGKIRVLDKEAASYGKLTNPVAVGDYVQFIIDTDFHNKIKETIALDVSHEGGIKKVPDTHLAVITNILPRKNCLVRQHPFKKNYNQIIASNVDIAVLVSVFVSGDDIYSYNKQLFYIDKFLVAAEYFGIFPVLLFNKVDLLNGGDKAALRALCKIYDDIGYRTMDMSATMSGKGITEFKSFITTKSHDKEGRDSEMGQLSFTKVLFTGNSGVGKSTIINNLTGGKLKTGSVSEKTQKGRHTTTHSVMIPIDNMTYIIDSPGIRSLFPSDLGRAYRQNVFKKHDLAFCFPEISKLLPCKFHNCTHIHEPGCKVIEALKNGKIAASRYENYKKILELV